MWMRLMSGHGGWIYNYFLFDVGGVIRERMGVIERRVRVMDGDV
jgi:hypothetical protein